MRVGVRDLRRAARAETHATDLQHLRRLGPASPVSTCVRATRKQHESGGGGRHQRAKALVTTQIHAVFGTSSARATDNCLDYREHTMDLGVSSAATQIHAVFVWLRRGWSDGFYNIVCCCQVV